jgi:hypothetical protein
VEEVRTAVRPWEARANALGLKRPEIARLGNVIDPGR